MRKINNLESFLKLNDFLQELKYLKKIATPLDAEYLPPADRADVLGKTKKIVPKVYIAKNLFDKELFDAIKDFAKEYFFIESVVVSHINTFTVKFLNALKYKKNKKEYKDKFGTRTVALSKDELFSALKSAASINVSQELRYTMREDKAFIYKQIYEKLIFKINSLPSEYDLYFIPAINVDPGWNSSLDFDYNKAYVYHDFIGHGFESLFLSFRNLIKDYMIDVLKEIFMIDASSWRLSTALETFVSIFGQENYNKLFGQEIASGLLNTDSAIRDSYYDLFSILLNDDIKISNLNIEGFIDPDCIDCVEATENDQEVFDSLSYTLEVELNSIKDQLIKNLNEELKSMGDKKYLIQYVDDKQEP